MHRLFCRRTQITRSSSTAISGLCKKRTKSSALSSLMKGSLEAAMPRIRHRVLSKRVIICFSSRNLQAAKTTTFCRSLIIRRHEAPWSRDLLLVKVSTKKCLTTMIYILGESHPCNQTILCRWLSCKTLNSLKQLLPRCLASCRFITRKTSTPTNQSRWILSKLLRCKRWTEWNSP